jgi:hypothetical protein
MPTPAFNYDLGFGERVEYLAVEEFIAKPRVERLDEAILPWASWRDVCRLRAHRRDPFLHSLRDELRAVVRTYVSRYATKNEQVR